MKSFFDPSVKSRYQTPSWLAKKLSRRHMLKSAAGATAMASVSSLAFMPSENAQSAFNAALNETVWQTLDAVFSHLLPASDSGPSAQDIQATFYLYQLVHQQPTAEDEIDFIYKGIGWLNGYTQSKQQKNFVELDFETKEVMLRAISRSTAGENWINMMLLNLYEAMLSPPAYGGNPNGIGWQWLNHRAGFPLPKAGQRYFELPTRSQAPQQTLSQTGQLIQSTDLLARKPLAFAKGGTKT